MDDVEGRMRGGEMGVKELRTVFLGNNREIEYWTMDNGYRKTYGPIKKFPDFWSVVLLTCVPESDLSLPNDDAE